MYLKVKTSEEANGWRIYECHKPQWHRMTRDEWDENIKLCEDVRYEIFVYSNPHAVQVVGEEEKPADVVVVSFYDESDQPIEVHGTLQMYLMNNSGATIQRIN